MFFQIINNFFFSLNSEQVFFDAAVERQTLFQTPASQIMDNIIDLHHDIFAVMIIIASVVFYLLLVVLIKYRSETSSESFNSKKRDFSYTHDTSLEIIWTLIPMWILILILIPSFVLLYSMDEIHDSQLTVKVLGRQWYWTYEFSISNDVGLVKTIGFDSYMLPDEELTKGGFRLLEVDNRIQIPVEVHTRFLVTSSDVLHSWAMPSFGVKMDACPGRLNQLGVLLYRMGIFYGQCSEICGVNHGFMPIVVEGVSLTEYIHWLENFS